MHLKEYPEVTAEGKVIATKTKSIDLIQNFSEQFHARGNTNMMFFTNREKVAEDVKGGDYPSGACWSPDFTPNDMVNLVMTFANMSLDPRQKLLFSSQLQNALLTEALNDEYEYEEFDEDEDYEDYDEDDGELN